MALNEKPIELKKGSKQAEGSMIPTKKSMMVYFKKGDHKILIKNNFGKYYPILETVKFTKEKDYTKVANKLLKKYGDMNIYEFYYAKTLKIYVSIPE